MPVELTVIEPAVEPVDHNVAPPPSGSVISAVSVPGVPAQSELLPLIFTEGVKLTVMGFVAKQLPTVKLTVVFPAVAPVTTVP